MDIRHTEADEPRPPAEGVLLATAAVLPIMIGALAAWVLPEAHVVHATTSWAGAVLCFLGGVRRGLSFRQPGGPFLSELATMASIFVFGVAGLLATSPGAALALLSIGYAEVGMTDVLAARRREAPGYLAHLRPVQIGVVLLALALLYGSTVWRNA